jgi:hypothetical protein
MSLRNLSQAEPTVAEKAHKLLSDAELLASELVPLIGASVHADLLTQNGANGARYNELLAFKRQLLGLLVPPAKL